MKILQLISGNLGQGGAERLVIDLSEAQADLGHDVTICSFRQPSADVISSLPSNVHFYTFGKTAGATPLLPFRIARYIRKEKFDVVNCHLTAVFLYVIWSLMVCRKASFYYTIHSNPYEEEPRMWVRIIRRFFIERNRLTFVGISTEISKRFIDLYGITVDVPVIVNGRKQQKPSALFEQVQQEVRSYRRNEQTKVFVAVGRLTREKNHELMLRAFSRIGANITLLVLGLDYNGFVETHKHEIPASVHFLGGKSNVYDYLLCADCFIMSSLYEGLPVSILEAYSAGLPVISTPVGGIPDVVKDGINGYLSDSSLSVDGFVETIERYLQSDEDTIELMRQNNENLFAAQFDITTTAKQYIALYAKQQ